ncbi:MAG: Na+:solute symporter [Phycisphaerae bacterium]|nr:Na+:solute symporter [Phycisphaerae bacterium]
MQIHPVDIAIINAYLVLIVAAGLVLSRRAARNLDSYFLGGKAIPWPLLSLSNASGMFDITGTMWLIALLFVYGMKSIWIPWLWPSFNQVFLMVYLAVWLRRSNVLTGAEWIRTRFGSGRGAALSQISVVIFALVSVVGFLACAFQGIGKFSAALFPWPWHPNVYAVIFMSVTTLYVILGGMYGVVLTDIIQFIVLTVAAIAVAAIAIAKTTPESIAAAVPEGWGQLFFGWRLNLDWSQIIASVNDRIADDGYSLFGAFFMMMLFKGVLSSMAGPAPNYDMQRILATRTPRESALMSWFVSVIVFFPRYLLIGGIAVLALAFFSPELTSMGSEVEFEQILPYVIGNFIPVGLVGLVLAGLFAAFMSTFDSTVNAGAAYLVNDVYKRCIAPDAPQRQYILASYAASLLIVLVGMAFGFTGKSIHDVLQWIVAGLFGGYVAPNVLKWYWWRLNGFGYFAGMISGIVLALLLPVLLPRLAPLSGFPIIFALSTAACFIASLLTPSDDEETLKQFYSTVRPWGFWAPVHRKVVREYPLFRANRGFVRDMFNVAVGIVWQTTFPVLALTLVLRQYLLFTGAFILLVATSLILKATWFDNLERK